MGSGKVIGGKYAGCAIQYDANHQILYISLLNGKKAKLTSRNIKNYRKRPDLAKSGAVAYIVKWVDNEKSVLFVPNQWDDLIVRSCETTPVIVTEVDAEEKDTRENRKSSMLSKIFRAFSYGAIGAFIILIIACLFFAIFGDSQSEEYASSGTWSEWDGESEKLSSDIVVQTTDTLALSYNSGVVSGYFINQSNSTFTHLEAIYEVTDDGVNVIGKCTFSTSKVRLQPGESQGFTAICNAWGENPHIKLASVGFH